MSDRLGFVEKEEIIKKVATQLDKDLARDEKRAKEYKEAEDDVVSEEELKKVKVFDKDGT